MNLKEHFQIHTCFIGSNWQDVGIANVVVVGKVSSKKFIVGIYLVDMWCLGIKDVSLRKDVNQSNLKFLMTAISVTSEGIDIISYEDARSIILGGLEFANAIGFLPHPDWDNTKYILEPDRSFKEKFTFGRDGKPFYCVGPNDKHNRKEYIKKVVAAGGAWGE